MIAIVDYGVGNLFSLYSSLKSMSLDTVISSKRDVLERADRIILPGVGAFKDARQKLKESGLDEVVIIEAKQGKPLLGICLGMQLLYDKSFEYGEHEGLGLIGGSVVPLSGAISGYKIPHMGWNSLDFTPNTSKLFKYINNGDYVYFVHSYFASLCDGDIIATANYGIDVTAAVANGNVFGTQFHPEKSGKVGLNILRAFAQVE